MSLQATELDLGNIKLDLDDDDTVSVTFTTQAFALIARTDPELFASMRKQNWSIRNCQRVECDRMAWRNAAASTLTKPGGTRFEDTVLNPWTIDTELEYTARKYGWHISKLHYVAELLVHEYVHLFQTIETGEEKTPVECALKFARMLGDDALIQYLEYLRAEYVDENGHWTN